MKKGLMIFGETFGDSGISAALVFSPSFPSLSLSLTYSPTPPNFLRPAGGRTGKRGLPAASPAAAFMHKAERGRRVVCRHALCYG